MEILAPGGLTTRYERDKVGRVTRVLGPDGLSLTSDYDARNNLTRRQRGGAQGPAISHSWAAADGWEGVGSSIPGSILQKTTDELGREWRDIYDDAFRRTREGHPTAGDTRYEYDALGRIVMRIAPGMGTEVIDWDAQGRIARRTYQGAAATVFRYDDHGRVLGVQDGLVHETRTYGPGMGLTSVQLAARTGFPEAAGFLLTRQTPRFDEELWRLEDREARITRAFDGRVLGLDLRSLIGNSQAQRYIEYAWDGARRMSSATYINGVTAEYDYHSATGLPRSVRLSGPHNTLELSVTYDEAGRPSALLDSEDQLSFEYDDDGRIAACGLERYTWDVTGARLSKGPNTYEREASGHLVDDGENTYTWDLAGRQAARNGEAPRTYIYGLDGLLKEVKEGELLLARFDYDAFGRRISKTTQAGRWLYGYMPDSDRLVRVVAPDQRIWHLYYTTSHSVFSLARRDDGFTQFVHLDPIGRVAAVSTSNGELHDLRGDCFGNRPESHPNLGIDIGFHGMLWDAETGLYYAGGRYYDPAIGEFLTPDPLGLVGGTAPYTYAAGNPIMMADPQGRLLFPFLGAVVAGGVIFKAIRDLTQSADTKRARRSYEDIALAVDLEDHHLDSAALAHKRLSKQAERGGEVAASGVAGFVGAAANPTQSAKQLIIEMSKETARAAAESFRSEGEEGEDED